MTGVQTCALPIYAITADPKYAHAYRGLSILLREEGNLEQARLIYIRRLDLEPNNFNVSLALAGICRQVDDRAGCSKYVEIARALIPAEEYYDLACLDSICGNFDAALEWLSKAVKQDGFDSAWARKDPDLLWVREDSRFEQILAVAMS